MLFLKNHVDALTGSFIGATTSIATTQGALPMMMHDVPTWLTWILPLVGSVLPVVGKYALGLVRPASKGAIAGLRSKATALRKRAADAESRGDHATASALCDRADSYDAAADALEAAENIDKG